MNARNKLNVAFVNGSLLLAAALGLVVQSWWLFIIALIALLAMNLSTGEIRTTPRHRR